LTLIDKYNEYMMVAFRTKEGVNLSHISEKFGADFHNKFMTIAQKQIEEKYMIVNDEYVSLTLEGILISNLLIENFVFV
jgi:coproporphyrinogen III oxidase-like Fe-S oxidoreductase